MSVFKNIIKTAAAVTSVATVAALTKQYLVPTVFAKVTGVVTVEAGSTAATALYVGTSVATTLGVIGVGVAAGWVLYKGYKWVRAKMAARAVAKVVEAIVPTPIDESAKPVAEVNTQTATESAVIETPVTELNTVTTTTKVQEPVKSTKTKIAGAVSDLVSTVTATAAPAAA